MKNKKITVEKQIKLLDLLSSIYKDYSNKRIKQLIKYNYIYVNDKIENNSSRVLNINDIVFIKLTDEEISLDIIYEDNDIIVINKPSGLLSISNKKEKERTAFRYVSDYLKKKDKTSKVFVVHRLDEATSGVLMFAKNIKIQKKLQSRWNDIVTKRKYYCILPGKVKEKGRIESYLTMNHNQIVHSTKDKTKGNLAITNYKLVKESNGYSLLEVCIETGRRNQIRVHMSENFKPILGDTKYGSKENPINRLALHASSLSLIDPRTNKEITFTSSIPKEMIDLLNN